MPIQANHKFAVISDQDNKAFIVLNEKMQVHLAKKLIKYKIMYVITFLWHVPPLLTGSVTNIFSVLLNIILLALYSLI